MTKHRRHRTTHTTANPGTTTEPGTTAEPGAATAATAPARSSYHGKTVSTSLDAAGLVNWLTRSQRPRPHVLLSHCPRTPNPLQAAIEAIGEEADVTLITGNAIRALAEAASLGPLAPYGGAARIFPADDGWQDDPKSVWLVKYQAAEGLDRFIRELAAETKRAPARGKSRPTGTPGTPGTPTAHTTHTGSTPARPTTASSTTGQSIPGNPADPANGARTRPSSRQSDDPAAIPFDPRGHAIVDAAHARAAIALIRNRRRPVVLITAPNLTRTPLVDVDAIVAEADGCADVLEIDEPDVVRTVTGALPDGERAWDGAVRVLPVKGGSMRYWRPQDPRGPQWATQAVIGDLRNAIYANGYTTASAPPAQAATHRRVTAVVKTLLDSQVMLQDADGGTYRLDSRPVMEQAELGTARLFHVGQHVHGTVRADTGDFEPELRWRDGHSAVAGYAPGDVVLARATGVFDDRMRVELFPDIDGQGAVSVTATAADLFADTSVPPDTDLRPIVPKDAVIALRIRSHDADGWHFAVPDRQGAAPAAAAVLQEGPGWLAAEDAFDWVDRLQEGRTLADVPLEELLDSARDADGLRATIARLHGQLADARGHARRLDEENRQLEKSNTQLRRHNRKAARALDDQDHLAPFRDRFATPAERMDWELRATAILRMRPEDRARHPLAGSWEYADGFLESVADCPDMQRPSLLWTMVAVACGLDDDLRGMNLHALRTGVGGDNPQRLDAEGRPIWRVTVHGQYRLHFSRRTDRDRSPVFIAATTHDELLW